MIGTAATLGKRSVSSAITSKIEFSPWPITSSCAGSSRASWRQSSLPMEPPAPVTSTVSPVASTRTCSRSVWIGSRRSRSWISTCRSEATATRPEMMSKIPGTVRVCTPASIAARTTWRTTAPRGPRHRDDDFLDVVAEHQVLDRRQRAVDREVAEPVAVLAPVVVHEADRD